MKVPSDEPRDALVTEEAIRHIVMDLKVTDVTAPGPFDNSALYVTFMYELHVRYRLTSYTNVKTHCTFHWQIEVCGRCLGSQCELRD
jgi:hypothetical protein